MKAVGRAVRVRMWDRLSASDPGLLRLTAGLRTVIAIAMTLVALGLLRFPVPQLVAGAMAAMSATFAVREVDRRPQAITLALCVPVAFAAVSLGAVLNQWPLVSDICFLLLIFCAVYGRRFGDRGTGLGLIGFQIYFLSLFVRATVDLLPSLFVVISVAFVCSALARFVLLPQTAAGTLDRLRRAFRARLGLLITSQIELLDAGPEDVDKVLGDLRTGTARLHETALMIQGRLEHGTDDEAVARRLQRRIAEAEIAAERLGLLLLTARSAERTDTLTLHLPGASLPSRGQLPVRDEARATVRRDLEALRLLVLRPAGEASGTALAQVRNRLLGYREAENLPKATPPVQDVFRGIGEAARAVLGLRTALDGPQDESDDSPATARSREELDAEEAGIEGSEESGDDKHDESGLHRPTTRAAIQVAVGSALAIAGGELLSSQRWYWAVLTCWIVFINTASTGEILVKGYRRLLGTILGVVAGIGLAGVVGHHTWTAFVLVLVCVFAVFYTAPLSYTLMSFFVTAALGLLYTLLNTYSMAVLLLRVEETALGAACGIITAAVVLPVRTDRRTNELLVDVLDKLADATRAAVDQLSGRRHFDLVDKARDMDQALADLRTAVQPLTHPITPLRSRRDTARYVLALLETCAYHCRALAATAELLPSHPSIAEDPRLSGVSARIVHNIEAIAEHVRDPHSPAAIETGPSIASMLEPGTFGTPRYGRVTDRVLRHLQRLDESVSGLARPLGVPVEKPDVGQSEKAGKGEKGEKSRKAEKSGKPGKAGKADRPEKARQ